MIPANQAGSKVEVIRSFTNVGPIPDFALVPTLFGESTQMVACSGTGKGNRKRKEEESERVI